MSFDCFPLATIFTQRAYETVMQELPFDFVMLA